MVAITISELTPSSIAEVDLDKIDCIRGGEIAVAVDSKLLEALPLLEAISGFFVNQTILDKSGSLSVKDVIDLPQLVPVRSAAEVQSSRSQRSRFEAQRFF